MDRRSQDGGKHPACRRTCFAASRGSLKRLAGREKGMNHSVVYALSTAIRVLAIVAACAASTQEVLAVVCSTAVSPCSGNANDCGTWVQIPSCGENYINCTNGWPAHMKATHMVLLRAGDGTGRVLMWHASCGFDIGP